MKLPFDLRRLRRRPVVIGAAGAGAVALAVALVVVAGGDRGPERSEPAASAGAFAPQMSSRIPPSRPWIADDGEGVTGRGSGEPVAVPRQLVVRFDPATSASERAAVLRRAGAEPIRRLGSLDAVVARIAPGSSRDAVRSRLAASPAVLYAEPNFVYRSSAVPNDPYFASLWGLHNSGQSVTGLPGTADADIDAPEAWDAATSADEVVVGVADTGVAYDHPDLGGNLWVNSAETAAPPSNGIDDDGNGYTDDRLGWDWVDDDGDPRDLNGHGTHVAGTIAATANDGRGVAGIAWDAAIMPLRVLDAGGAGTTADIAAAFLYAARNGADIVNASFGGPGASQLLLDAIAVSPQTLFVVAAGNEGADNDTTASYPCNYAAANLVCVAATTSTDALASFSNYGHGNVDLGAPGTRILSTAPTFVTPLTEGFEGDLAERWVTGGLGGTWGIATDAAGGFLADSPVGNYAPDIDSTVTWGATLDLSGLAGCTLSYALYVETERGKDILRLQASSGGDTWTTISGWSGSSGGKWIAATDDLSGFDGSATTQLRFRFVSDAGTESDGVGIDDLRLQCTSPQGSGDYRYASGTSMATPHVAGAAALLWGVVPDASVAEIRAALLAGDPLPALADKTVTGARLNLERALRVLAPAAALPPDDAPATQAPAGSPEPEPQPSDTASASPSASPNASPTNDDAAPADGESPRSLTLALRRHLRARGRVVSPAGNNTCFAEVTVIVKRNGRVIARLQSDADGRYRARVADRPGRYVAIVRRASIDGTICGRAVSAMARHRH